MNIPEDAIIYLVYTAGFFSGIAFFMICLELSNRKKKHDASINDRAF